MENFFGTLLAKSFSLRVMVTKFGTVLAKPILRMRINFNRISGQKMTARSFYLPTGPTFIQGASRLFLEHVVNRHSNTIIAQNFERTDRWLMLNDGVAIFIGEYCEVIFCMQESYILLSLLLTREGVVCYTHGCKTLLLKCAYDHRTDNLLVVSERDNIFEVSERRIASIEAFSGWEL